jgi:hypothetical protein
MSHLRYGMTSVYLLLENLHETTGVTVQIAGVSSEQGNLKRHMPRMIMYISRSVYMIIFAMAKVYKDA